jgi:hypothetical protein
MIQLKTLDRFRAEFSAAFLTYPDSPVEHVTHRFCAPPFDRSSGEGLPD